MNDKEFVDLKKKLFPIELQEHFIQNQGVNDRNFEKYEIVMEAIQKSNTPHDQKVVYDYILDSLKNFQHTVSVLFDHNEMAYFYCFLLRDQVKQMEKTLNTHGIVIERITGYEDGLRFVDDYIKHSSGDKEIE